MHKGSLSNAQKYENAMEYHQNITPEPFNPLYDKNFRLWWPGYCKRVRNELLQAYKSLYPNQPIDIEHDSDHLNSVRHEILRKFVDLLREKFVSEAKKEAGL